MAIAHRTGNGDFAGAARHAAVKPYELPIRPVPTCKAHRLLAGLAFTAQNDTDEAAGPHQIAAVFLDIGNRRADIADALTLHGDCVPSLFDELSVAQIF